MFYNRINRLNRRYIMTGLIFCNKKNHPTTTTASPTTNNNNNNNNNNNKNNNKRNTILNANKSVEININNLSSVRVTRALKNVMFEESFNSDLEADDYASDDYESVHSALHFEYIDDLLELNDFTIDGKVISYERLKEERKKQTLRQRIRSSRFSRRMIRRFKTFWDPTVSSQTSMDWWKHAKIRHQKLIRAVRQDNRPKTVHEELRKEFLEWEAQRDCTWPSQLVSTSELTWRVFNSTVRKQLSMHVDSPMITFQLERIIQQLAPLGRLGEHNHVTIYDDGDDAFKAMWSAMENAQSSICYETYILADDIIGMHTIGLLTNAAKRGLEVMLIYDDFGSWKLSSNLDILLDKLKRAGGLVYKFNPIVNFPHRHWRVGFRTHRKLLVVDREIGFTGGMNTSNEYAGLKTGGINKFRDTHVRVFGPSAEHFYGVFMDSLYEATGDDDYLPRSHNFMLLRTYVCPEDGRRYRWRHGFLKTAPVARLLSRYRMNERQPPAQIPPIRPRIDGPIHSSQSNGCFVQVLENNRHQTRNCAQRAYVVSLVNAQKEVLIENPYFYPSRTLRRALIIATLRGVRVRIVTTGFRSSDVGFMAWASQHLHATLIRHGIEMYEYTGRKLHSKVCVIDSFISIFGSSNLELWSYGNTLEINLSVLDSGVARTARAQIMKDIKQSKRITGKQLANRRWYEKILHATCYYAYYLIYILFGRLTNIVLGG